MSSRREGGKPDGRLLVIVLEPHDDMREGLTVVEWGDGPRRWDALDSLCGPGLRWKRARVAFLEPDGPTMVEIAARPPR